MNMDIIPVWGVFLGTIFIVMASVELGYRLGGVAIRRSPDEKESPVSAMTGAVLGLTAFILAFTFSIATNRFDARKELVRQEANAIGTAYLRTDFLSETDRVEAKRIFREYVDLRIKVTTSANTDREQLVKFNSDTLRLQDRLWQQAVEAARKDMHSDIMALYVDALNLVIDIHSLRVAVLLQSRVPTAIWLVLYGMTILGMAGMGYQTGIAGSKRSMARPILALSFALVFLLIAALDRPNKSFITVTQQPLIDLRTSMPPQ